MQAETVLIVGVGLIGGSLGGALRQAGFAGEVIGMDVDPAALATAVSAGLIDRGVSEVPNQVDIIVVCTSSDQIAQQVAQWSDRAELILDVGSVKAPILDSLAQSAGGVPTNFVPCHPIAGSERSGPGAARADLFAGTVTVLCAPAGAPAARAAAVWEAAGASVCHLSAADHDAMLAVTSHLPHLLAFAFMLQVDEEQLSFAGGGFRDFTRIAAANPELWWRILRMNRSQVLRAAETFGAHLEQLTRVLAEADESEGMRLLRSAAHLRQQL